MSWELTGAVSRRNVGGPTRRLLLLTICDKANNDGTGVYASVPTLARDSEISVSSVRRALKEFLDEGLLVHVGMRPCRNGQTNEFAVNVDALNALPLIERPKTNPSHSDTPATTKGVSQRKPQIVGEGDDQDTKSTAVVVTPLPPRRGTPVTLIAKPILEPIPNTQVQEFSLTPPPQPKAARKAKTQAQRIAHEWVPDTATRRYAEGLGFAIWEIEAAAEEFREYWEGRDDRLAYKLDWNITFKGRLRDLAAEPKMRNKLRFVKPAVNGHALITPEQWAMGLKMWNEGRRWITELGPKPNQPGYRGPATDADGVEVRQ